MTMSFVEVLDSPNVVGLFGVKSNSHVQKVLTETEKKDTETKQNPRSDFLVGDGPGRIRLYSTVSLTTVLVRYRKFQRETFYRT